jgi:hypothetical protein
LSCREPSCRLAPITEALGGEDAVRIFAHALTSLGNFGELARQVPGMERYAERALLAARPRDVVCLVAPVDPGYLELLRGIGVGPRSENVVVVSGAPGAVPSLPDLLQEDRALERLRELVGDAARVVLDVYTPSAKEAALAARLEAALGRAVDISAGPLPVVEWALLKHHVRAEALALGIPLARGEVVTLAPGGDGRPADLQPLEAAVRRWIGATGRVLVRGSFGGAGTATTVIENEGESLRAACGRLAQRRDNCTYLVEEMLDVEVSPNVQMLVGEDEAAVQCVGVSDQLLVAAIEHEGNLSPSRAECLPRMLEDAAAIARALARRGYRGLCGLDFGEYRAGRRRRHFFAEVNPRVNAATYATFLVAHLNAARAEAGEPPLGAWLAMHHKTSATAFPKLRERWRPFLFDPASGAGVVPYNVACLPYGKCGAILVGRSREEVLELRTALDDVERPATRTVE